MPMIIKQLKAILQKIINTQEMMVLIIVKVTILDFFFDKMT